MPPPDPRQYDAAAAWFRDRVPISDEEWEALQGKLREQAFKIAGVAQLDIVTQVWEALDRAIADGTSFDDFKDEVTASLSGAWGGAYPYRVETIFLNWTQRAYSAGRYETMTAPAVKQMRPFWQFLNGDPVSDICVASDGTILPADDPWWADHNPPLHHRCKSGVISLTAEEAGDDVDDTPPDVDADDGFGGAPTNDWDPDLSDYPGELASAYQEKSG